MNSDRLINRGGPVTNGDWLHIVPAGVLHHADTDQDQILDDVSLDSILMNVSKDEERLGDKWTGVYGGREHHIYDPNQDSVALAWFKRFQKRQDGIYAHRDGLTDIGREAIANGRYKYTSFVALPEGVQKLGGKKVRITKIDTIGFTNAANGKDLLTPLTNRSYDPLHQRAKAPALISNRNAPESLKRMGFGSALYNRDGQPTGKAVIRMQDFLASYQRSRKLRSFDDAWNECQALRNRFANRDAAADIDALWQEASKKEQEAYDLSWSIHYRSEDYDRGVDVLYARGGQPTHLFISEVEKVMQERGLDFAKAWESLRETEPVFWLRHVLSITDGSSPSFTR